MIFPRYRKLVRTNERLKRENKKLEHINKTLFDEIKRRENYDNRTKKQR